jgi:inosine-uridine nucleoside N-ribohydrolase
VPTYPSDLDYWGEVIKPRPGPAHEALTLLRRSLEGGATVVGIGPFTNLAAIEELWPGILAPANLVLMGTSVLPPAEGLPQWGPQMDYNVQQDVAAASVILSSSSPLLVPLGVSMHAAIRNSHLARLRSGGTLAQLIARQAEAFDAEWHNAERYRSASSVPNDMINFLYDPVACAIAAGWRDRVSIETLPVVWEICEDQLVQRIDRGGKPLPVVTGLDGLALEEEWVRRVSSATLESVVA